jgi:hypothetical protein
MVRVVVAWLALCLPVAAYAQPATEDVEVEPLTCWWRANAGAVRMGQPFTVVLTCAMVETASTRVVADHSRLDASVVQLPPFEVTGGRRADDLRTVGQRFIQYEYVLRLLAEQAFARDVAVPPLTVSYRIETRTGENGSASQGREQTYELPVLPLRVASLVASDSTDIREAAPATLAEIDARAFRARMMRIGALAMFVVSGLVLLAGAVGAARGRRVATHAKRQLDEAAILKGAARTLADVRARQSRGGEWTPELLGRAIGALRIVASIATGRAVSQRVLSPGDTPVEGEIVVGGGFGREPRAISGSATPTSLSRSSLPGHNGSLLREVADGLSRLDAGRYGRNSTGNPDIDTALDSGARLARAVASQHGWIAARRTAMTRTLQRWTPRSAA